MTNAEARALLRIMKEDMRLKAEMAKHDTAENDLNTDLTGGRIDAIVEHLREHRFQMYLAEELKK